MHTNIHVCRIEGMVESLIITVIATLLLNVPIQDYRISKIWFTLWNWSFHYKDFWWNCVRFK